MRESNARMPNLKLALCYDDNILQQIRMIVLKKMHGPEVLLRFHEPETSKNKDMAQLGTNPPTCSSCPVIAMLTAGGSRNTCGCGRRRSCWCCRSEAGRAVSRACHKNVS